MIYFRIVYNSFFIAMSIALTLFKNFWLQQRANIGYLFLLSWVLLMLVFTLVFRNRGKYFGLLFTVVNIVICSVYSLTLYGIARIQIIPASLIREGLPLGRTPFSTINTALIIFMLLGLLIIVYNSLKKGAI